MDPDACSPSEGLAAASWPPPGLLDAWWLVASSRELGKRKPCAVQVLGQALVLFRDEQGTICALEDRCPHRHVALSLGQVCDGQVQCAYHGWRFDGEGRCVSVPTALDGQVPAARVRRYPAHEFDGSIWVWMGNGAPSERHQPGWAFPGSPPHGTVEICTDVECGILHVMNNFVDCAHTGFVHAGLFRGTPSKQLRAVVQETPQGVRIDNYGETDQNSLLARLLVPKGVPIEHIDEVLLPHSVRVTYTFDQRKIITISTCLAVSEHRTRIFTRLYVDFGVATKAVVAGLKRMTHKILAQDKRILDNQGAQIQRYGERFAAGSVADMPTVWVSRAFTAWCNHAFPPDALRTHEAEYLL